MQIAFADAVKRTVRLLYDFSEEQLWGALRDAPDLRYPRAHGPFVDGSGVHGKCACCGWDVDLNLDFSLSGPKCYLVPRFAIHAAGTEFGRALYEDTWTRIALDAARKVLTGEACYDRLYGVVARLDSGLCVSPNSSRVGSIGLVNAPSPARGVVVVSDVRWPAGNEGRRVVEVGGELWRIDRSGISTTTNRTHASERQDASDEVFSRVIKNDGPLEDLEARVAEAIEGRST